jgi:hypothetical protein
MGYRTQLSALGLAAAVLGGCEPGPSLAASTDALTLEAKIPLGEVGGRLDHLAVDLGQSRRASAMSRRPTRSMSRMPATARCIAIAATISRRAA